jgi:7-alpha-hydroxysteroid dehydrogenase
MLFDKFSMTDRVAVITGAGRGIGASIARTFAEAGGDVVIAARTESQLDEVAADVRAHGRRALVVPCDVSEEANLESLIAAAVAEFDGIDVMVNNAGGSMPAPLMDTSTRAFEKAFHFNVTTAFALTRLCVPHMLDRPNANVINISSAIGRLADRGFTAYGTAKGALSHMTRLTAADLAPAIRVNAIAVGSVATSALEVVLGDDAIRNEMIDRTPLGRLGEVEDIALGALWLASDAGSWVTGKVIEIDGGIEAGNLDMNIPDVS